jgi:chromate transporter
MNLLHLFWIFIKINLLSTSGPSSVGLLYAETVGSIMTEEEFVKAVGVSSALPGSDALQLAMFVGHSASGIPGALVALLGSILPPTVLMLGIVGLLKAVQSEAWVSNFVHGITPAIAALLVLTAWQVLGENQGIRSLFNIMVIIASFIALILKVPSPLVLLIAGLLGIVLLR